jgi:hypothetical protein
LASAPYSPFDGEAPHRCRRRLLGNAALYPPDDLADFLEAQHAAYCIRRHNGRAVFVQLVAVVKPRFLGRAIDGSAKAGLQQARGIGDDDADWALGRITVREPPAAESLQEASGESTAG